MRRYDGLWPLKSAILTQKIPKSQSMHFQKFKEDESGQFYTPPPFYFSFLLAIY